MDWYEYKEEIEYSDDYPKRNRRRKIEDEYVYKEEECYDEGTFSKLPVKEEKVMIKVKSIEKFVPKIVVDK